LEDLILYITILFISLSYLLIGFGINKENAKYLLAGYNTMSEEKKEKFNIDKYLKFFKPFFKRLSIFPPASFLLSSFFFEGNNLVLVWTFLQLLPYVLFFSRSFKYK
jgi:hypothetical protein